MTGSDLISALGGKVVPFDLGGVPLWLRPLTMGDLTEYKAIKDADVGKASAILIAYSVVTESGERALTVEQAGSLPVKAAQALAARIAQLNGFEDDPEGKAS